MTDIFCISNQGGEAAQVACSSLGVELLGATPRLHDRLSRVIDEANRDGLPVRVETFEGKTIGIGAVIVKPGEPRFEAALFDALRSDGLEILILDEKRAELWREAMLLPDVFDEGRRALLGVIVGLKDEDMPEAFTMIAEARKETGTDT